jgi:endonuclease/exonuclease/phosphatase family metal-dependent hydrolase
VGDFNDTPYSPYLEPLIKSPYLINVLREHRAEDDYWTYFWRDKNRVSQIDYILASKALAQRIKKVAQNDKNKKPHIERKELAYKTAKSGDILPATLIHFKEDPVTSNPSSTAPEKSKVPFDHKRFKEIENNRKKNISDHCPVKIWF